jgi:hypothetical protein
MISDIAVQDQERNVQAAHDVLSLLEQHNMEFVAREKDGQLYVDVHINGNVQLIGGARNKFNVASANRIYTANVELLEKIQDQE